MNGPILRAWSHYLWSFGQGDITETSAMRPLGHKRKVDPRIPKHLTELEQMGIEVRPKIPP